MLSDFSRGDQLTTFFLMQLSQQSSLLQQLSTADRESLLAEIRQLRATINAMRDEQRKQVATRSQ